MVKLAALAVTVALLALLHPAATVVEFTKEDLESDDSMWKLYELWGARHKVARDPGEKLRRFAIFKEVARGVYDSHLRFGGETPLGLNIFADLSDDEVPQNYKCATSGVNDGQKNRSVAAAAVKSRRGNGTLPLPPSVDWRYRTCHGHPCLTPVKNQYNCSSCWAFAATAAMESHYAIRVNSSSLVRLSEQELVDCDPISHKCACGYAAFAFLYVKENEGLSSSGAYPYTARNGTCQADDMVPVRLGVTGLTRVQPYDEYALLDAVTNGPVVVNIDAKNTYFYRYPGGLYPTGECGRNPFHEMLLVGYASSYYILRNSYGEGWGDKGYMYLPRKNDTFGACGIFIDGGSYPEIASDHGRHTYHQYVLA